MPKVPNMLLSSFADNIHISITTRIRLIFSLYSALALSYSILVIVTNSQAVSFHLFYEIMFPLATLSCLMFICKPKLGTSSLYLAPLFIIALVRTFDIWTNYFKGDTTLEVATRGSYGWSILLVSIVYIDLLESKIYHQLVNYIEQKTDRRPD